MVHYPNPKYIHKAHLRGVRPFTFSAVEKRADHVATSATCLRCAQNVSKQRRRCDKTEHRRCDHCTKGNRGACTLVPDAMNGRLNRLYGLRTRYDTAVTNAAVPRTDAAVVATGVKLARCQRQFNLELTNRRRLAAHTGTPMGVPTQVPTTTPQFLGLILVEQRRIAAALEQAVAHLARAGGGGGGDDSSDSDSGGSGAPSEASVAPRARAIRKARRGRGSGAGSEHEESVDGGEEAGGDEAVGEV